jgi:glycosyltransferase involved in cell wall biosynthesis
METNPLVTVFIPVYNREKYILEAVNSILRQTFTNFELIVVDDGSTDNTPKILKSIKDKRLKLFFNKKNMGIPYTRNKGLEISAGKYIALLDSDDIAIPNRLEKQLLFFKKHPDCACVGSFEGVIDENSHLKKTIKCRYTNPDYIHSSLLFFCPISNRSVMAKSSILKALKYKESFDACQDYDLFVRLFLANYALYNINEILVFRREHLDRITHYKWRISFNKRMEIAKNQLIKLNFKFTEKDLFNHMYLRETHIKRDLFNIDINFIKWAEQWLTKLIIANIKTRLYPGKAFKSLIGKRWRVICFFADKDIKHLAIKYFFKSRLFKYALFSLAADLTQHYINKIICKSKLSKIYKSTFINF